MINLQQRSYTKELMDADSIPFTDMEQVLKELNFINTWLGGHAITIKGVKALARSENLTICEIGCGGGDNLFAIHRWCIRNGIKANFIGIDLNSECIEFARNQYAQLDCRWICSDYKHIDFGNDKPAIIFSSLFCHHFTNEQMVSQLQWLKQNCSDGFFINDLHRHWLAYYLIKFLTGAFSHSRLVRNDACLSVARGFRKKDWRHLFQMAGIKDYRVRWQWAFRWLVLCREISKH